MIASREAEDSPSTLGASLLLEPFSQATAKWRGLLAEVSGATLYHREAWIELLVRAYRFSLWLATIHDHGRVLAGCVLARSRNPFARRLISLPFSDACPPLALDSEAAHALLNSLTQQGLPGATYEIRGIGGMTPWQTVECFANWSLNLNRPLATIERALDSDYRRNLRRAARQAIRIEHGSGLDYVERFYALQLESRRRLGLPPQPWRFFALVQEIFAARGDLDVWIAREAGQDVASAVFLRDGHVIHYKWGARRAKQESSVNHLLFWNAIEEFVTRSQVLDLGRTDVRNLGLTRFKRALGATATPVPFSFYPRAPRQVSPEVLTGTQRIISSLWRRLPISATKTLGGAIYGFLT
jgi:Acetyltransferase (GNAT) domain